MHCNILFHYSMYILFCSLVKILKLSFIKTISHLTYIFKLSKNIREKKIKKKKKDRKNKAGLYNPTHLTTSLMLASPAPLMSLAGLQSADPP